MPGLSKSAWLKQKARLAKQQDQGPIQQENVLAVNDEGHSSPKDEWSIQQVESDNDNSQETAQVEDTFVIEDVMSEEEQLENLSGQAQEMTLTPKKQVKVLQTRKEILMENYGHLEPPVMSVKKGSSSTAASSGIQKLEPTVSRKRGRTENKASRSSLGKKTKNETEVKTQLNPYTKDNPLFKQFPGFSKGPRQTKLQFTAPTKLQRPPNLTDKNKSQLIDAVYPQIQTIKSIIDRVNDDDMQKIVEFQRNECKGFSTLSGKRLEISQNAMEEAEKRLQTASNNKDVLKKMNNITQLNQ